MLEGMSHVQVARYVGGWNRDAIGFTVTRGREVIVFFPFLVPGLFDVLR